MSPAMLPSLATNAFRFLSPVARALVCLSLFFVGCNAKPPTDSAASGLSGDPVRLMRAAMRRGDWQLADRHAQRALIANPSDADLVTDGATIAAFSGRKREGAQLLVDAAALAQYQPATRVDVAVQALIEVGEVYPAIELLEKSLQTHPDRDGQRRILVGFWLEVQRTDRIRGHLKKLIQNRNFDFPLLIATTDTSSRRLSQKTSTRLLERNPKDRRVRLADAFLQLYRRNAGGAVEVLEDILEHHHDFAPAHAMYGQALAASARWGDIPQWLENAPKGSSDFADYWLTLGDLAGQRGELAEAARAYWKATRRDPNRNEAWDRLRHSLHRLRASDPIYADAVPDAQLQAVTDHTGRFLELRERFNDFSAGGSESQRLATDVARILFRLGRTWEAEAWSAAATTLHKDLSPELAPLRGKILEKLRRDSDWFANDTPALAIDLSAFPQPSLDAASSDPKRSSVIPAVTSHDHLRLSEQSNQWGLNSVGEGNNTTDPSLAVLIRSTGVGGGTIDYDLDGLPDLMIMNAGGTMLKTDSQPNDLMRNEGSKFVRVSASAGVDETSFGQGVAVGDFNEDGFADLFFANLGTNRLMRNNGDGTFTDCSDQLVSDVVDVWSTSGSFVDIDEDGIADLVVTNYCQTVPELDQACLDQNGVLGPCHPLTFAADRDQFFRGTASGRMIDVTADWVGSTAPGRGLGILCGALDGQNLGIFIANDMSQNAYYSRTDEGQCKLVDSASARGVAVDGRSLAQASMGIAGSDFDGDGDLDLYVTGFGREYNVYYEQIVPGLWTDETANLGLVEPTLSVIGFGTQSIDLDNDGVEEIIVTNGHIGAFSEPGSPPYEQHLQIFRRGPGGGFLLIDDDAWSDYFSVSHVGRALWTTDVNRDGRNDAVITHSNEQVCLLINETQDQNDRIAFKLVATDCSRDAVGAVIRFRCNGRPRTLWALSGDGYFCSNEKTFIAGLGKAAEVTDVTVTWQDGSKDQVGTLESNTQYLITQGQVEAFPLYRYPSPEVRAD